MNLTDTAGIEGDPKPGDLYSIDPEGSRIEGPLCRLGAADEQGIDSSDRTIEFHNLLGEWLPVVAELADVIFGSADTAEAKSATAQNTLTSRVWDARVAQFGSHSALLDAVRAQIHVDARCQSDVEHLLAHRYFVCFISQVYNSNDGNQPLALAFNSQCLSSCDDDNCFSTAGAIKFPEVNRPPVTSRLKIWLDLIDYEDKTASAAGRDDVASSGALETGRL